ncbi:hypothetical protein SARC_01492 [Sphaeroforma arctica JP610]|uniref:Uncharacterized protein n=1 Tax=Sphaeroforma arctica JP610 TaxID=667725 RepID=A0A0L0GBI1_9EUKA|nr:hypothetical protein SARC_01492 [Sphaeroforma arctica JP610]KNC86360.1 hypothetical protein SARC_01492 [Sphaeroforma arctica JP610]|eukprot:XP_014160262.1 hypothetical protein SARC_01492 [Sphaeroforma arctica JP610]
MTHTQTQAHSHIRSQGSCSHTFLRKGEHERARLHSPQPLKRTRMQEKSDYEPPRRLSLNTIIHDMNKYIDTPIMRRHLAWNVKETIMPEQFYTRCFNTSHCSLVSGAAALILGHVTLGIMCLFVWLTSVNYWRYPCVGFRRTIDIVTVQATLWTHIYKAMSVAAYQHLYMATVAVGMLCYGRARYHHFRGDHDNDTKWHCTMHLIGNASNVILYVGLLTT